MNYLELSLGALAFLVNAAATLAIYRSHPKSWTSRLVVVFWALTAAYIVVNYLSLHPPSPDLETQLFWIRAVIAVTSPIFPLLVALAATIPGRELSLRPWQIASLVAVGLTGAVLSFTPAMFSALVYTKGVPTPIPGPAIIFHGVNLFGSYLLAVVISVRRSKLATLVDKPVHLYFVIGLSTSFLLSVATAFFATAVFASTRTVFLGPLVWSIFFVFLSQILPRPEKPAFVV